MQTEQSQTKRGSTMGTGFWLAVSLALIVAASLQLTSVAEDSQTIDEAADIASGYSYWKTGDFRLNLEHPPIAKLLGALPLLVLQPDFSPPADAWEKTDAFAVGKAFLYENRIPADTLLLAGRAMTMLQSAILGFVLAWWVGKEAGRAAGIAAVLLFAFEPTVIAHSRYITSDIPVTLFMWLSFISWLGYLRRPTRGALIRTGLLTGLAIATKFSALILFLILALLWLAHRKWVTREGFVSPARTAAMLLIFSFLVANSAYFFDTRSLSEDPGLSARLAKAYPANDSMRSRVLQTALNTPVPGYFFLRGLQLLIKHGVSGHPAYLFGTVYEHGTWKYFPIALLVKSSAVWLILLFGSLVVTAWRATHSSLEEVVRSLPFRLLLPAVIYFAIAVASSIDIGIRHLLPIFPFLCAFISITLFSKGGPVWSKAITWGLVFVFLLESASAYPNYVSFFNAAAGSTRNGHPYLLDSNLDWGQDLKRLKTWTGEHDASPLCLAYFGTVEPSYYGIQYEDLRSPQTPEKIGKLDCVFAISANYLFGAAEYASLRERTPTDRAGESIYIYDLRKR